MYNVIALYCESIFVACLTKTVSWCKGHCNHRGTTHASRSLSLVFGVTGQDCLLRIAHRATGLQITMSHLLDCIGHL